MLAEPGEEVVPELLVPQGKEQSKIDPTKDLYKFPSQRSLISCTFFNLESNLIPRNLISWYYIFCHGDLITVFYEKL
ncbi:hypothetical protein BpHYR1_015537, partial [Brachionus plicatilis]